MDKVYCASVWFASAQEQKTIALTKGAKAEDIHTEDVGAEGWQSLLQSYRGRGGRLGLVGGFYVIGQTSDALKARLAELRKLKIKPYDLESGEEDGAKLYEAAIASIMGSKKFKRSKKHHKAVSAKGGKGKLESMRGKRMPEEIARPIWQCEKLTADERLKLLNPPGYFAGKWTAASAYRHLGKK